jgi:hypothetical protein
MSHRPQGAGHFFCYSCPTQPCVGPAVCELKTRTKDANIEAELTYVCENNLNRFHHVTTLDEFHPRVEEPENRVQLMHHLGARGRRFGLHVVARPGTIMRVVLLEISDDQREAGHAQSLSCKFTAKAPCAVCACMHACMHVCAHDTHTCVHARVHVHAFVHARTHAHKKERQEGKHDRAVLTGVPPPSALFVTFLPSHGASWGL